MITQITLLYKYYNCIKKNITKFKVNDQIVQIKLQHYIQRYTTHKHYIYIVRYNIGFEDYSVNYSVRKIF